MTVSYQYEVASSTSGGFTRLLFMWRGSLYKLIYRELLLFLILFGALSALYRNAFTTAQKKEFEQIVIYCDTFIKLIPLSFVLGFYVSYVAGRWWKQYKAIPWPDKVMHLVALYVSGNDEYGRMLRRALMRYLNLSLILVLRSISSAVKRRFPTLDHVVDSGFMTSLELELFQSVPSVEFNTYWIPCTWFINLLKEARKNHRLPDAQGLKLIMEEFNDFRSKCGLLWSYDWVSIPLVYTQVVTLATYSFFAVALVGRQYIEGAEKQFQLKIDIYLPIFTILQFFFFMGLLKVAEQLINPFGDDDEDFELNWLIDRHTKVSYLGVDTLMNRCPPLVKDIFFDSENLTLPYTEAAAAYKRKTYRGSVANMTVPEEKQTMFLPGIIEEEEEDTKNTPTPRTSTASLATHPNDSPVNERRQISGSPPATPKMARNYSETVLQMDYQEAPAETEQQTDQRRIITEAVKKFSALAKYPRTIDQSRKPFFGLARPPKLMLQPWPSATNLARSQQSHQSHQSHQSQQQQQQVSLDTPMATDGDFNPWRRSSVKSLQRVPPLEVSSPSSPSSPEEELEEGIVNTAFSSERLPEDRDSIAECDPDTPSSDCPCRQEDGQQLEFLLEEDEPDDEFRSRVDSCSGPSRSVRRHRSTGGSCRRKNVHWKPTIGGGGLNLRRRTTDSVPVLEDVLHQARSSPNLSHLEDRPEKTEDTEKVEDTKL